MFAGEKDSSGVANIGHGTVGATNGFLEVVLVGFVQRRPLESAAPRGWDGADGSGCFLRAIALEAVEVRERTVEAVEVTGDAEHVVDEVVSDESVCGLRKVAELFDHIFVWTTFCVGLFGRDAVHTGGGSRNLEAFGDDESGEVAMNLGIMVNKKRSELNDTRCRRMLRVLVLTFDW
jgi:hypothetical protein